MIETVADLLAEFLAYGKPADAKLATAPAVALHQRADRVSRLPDLHLAR